MFYRKLGQEMVLALASLALLAALGCPKGEEAVSAPVVEPVATAEFLVKNMTCESCNKAIKTTLEKLDGVALVQTDFTRGYASANYDPNKISTDELVDAINGLGFESRIRKPGDVDIPPSPHSVPETGEGV